MAVSMTTTLSSRAMALDHRYFPDPTAGGVCVAVAEEVAGKVSMQKARILQVLLLYGKRYGLQIIDDVARLTDGCVRLHQGTLYPALRALEEEGMVVSEPEDGAASRGGRPRYYYALTALGVQVIQLKRKEILATFSPEPAPCTPAEATAGVA